MCSLTSQLKPHNTSLQIPAQICFSCINQKKITHLWSILIIAKGANYWYIYTWLGCHLPTNAHGSMRKTLVKHIFKHACGTYFSYTFYMSTSYYMIVELSLLELSNQGFLFGFPLQSDSPVLGLDLNFCSRVKDPK